MREARAINLLIAKVVVESSIKGIYILVAILVIMYAYANLPMWRLWVYVLAYVFLIGIALDIAYFISWIFAQLEDLRQQTS